MTITIPERMARKIRAVAEARDESVDAVAAEALELSPLLSNVELPDVDDVLAAFIGSADSGDPSWAGSDIHVLRKDLAERKWSAGTESL